MSSEISAVHDSGKRVSSIARSIGWSYWWRRLLNWLFFDALVIAGIASIIVVDTVKLRGEGYTFSRRVERYKVAYQFLWFDFKDAVSKNLSESPQAEPEGNLESVEPPEPGSTPEP